MDFRFLSQEPYWFRQHLDVHDGDMISFGEFSPFSRHGDIDVDSLMADHAGIKTLTGDVRHGILKVPVETLRIEAENGSVIPMIATRDP